MSKIVNGVRV